MKNVNVYNNGHGWRISFPLGRVIQVLTVEEAMDLHGALESAIEYAESASHQADPADGIKPEPQQITDLSNTIEFKDEWED